MHEDTARRLTLGETREFLIDAYAHLAGKFGFEGEVPPVKWHPTLWGPTGDGRVHASADLNNSAQPHKIELIAFTMGESAGRMLHRAVNSLAFDNYEAAIEGLLQDMLSQGEPLSPDACEQDAEVLEWANLESLVGRIAGYSYFAKRQNRGHAQDIPELFEEYDNTVRPGYRVASQVWCASGDTLLLPLATAQSWDAAYRIYAPHCSYRPDFAAVARGEE